MSKLHRIHQMNASHMLRLCMPWQGIRKHNILNELTKRKTKYDTNSVKAGKSLLNFTGWHYTYMTNNAILHNWQLQKFWHPFVEIFQNKHLQTLEKSVGIWNKQCTVDSQKKRKTGKQRKEVRKKGKKKQIHFKGNHYLKAR